MRHVNRVLAALLSLALIVVSILLIIEVIADRINHRPALVHWNQAYNWAQHTTWNAGSIQVTSVILIAAGLALLAAQLTPARVARLEADPARAGAAGIATSYTRRGLATAVRSAVLDVDGVQAASVKVKRRKVCVTAVAAGKGQAAARDVREPVSAAVRQRLTTLHLLRPPPISVRATPGSR